MTIWETQKCGDWTVDITAMPFISESDLRTYCLSINLYLRMNFLSLMM